MIKVELAAIKDIPELADLWYKFAKDAAPESNPNKVLWADMIKGYMESADTSYRMVVGLDDDVIVAFADAFIMHQPSTDKIHGIGQHFYTHPVYRKTNIASVILLKLVDWGKQHNVEIIELFTDTVEDSFWLKHKFKPQTLIVRRMM